MTTAPTSQIRLFMYLSIQNFNTKHRRDVFYQRKQNRRFLWRGYSAAEKMLTTRPERLGGKPLCNRSGTARLLIATPDIEVPDVQGRRIQPRNDTPHAINSIDVDQRPQSGSVMTKMKTGLRNESM